MELGLENVDSYKLQRFGVWVGGSVFESGLARTNSKPLLPSLLPGTDSVPPYPVECEWTVASQVAYKGNCHVGERRFMTSHSDFDLLISTQWTSLKRPI